MDFSGLFGAAGSIAGAAISANAVQNATQMQVDALNRQREFVFSNLNPDLINTQATSADQRNAYSRLMLQRALDPALYATRYAGENQVLDRLNNLGQQPEQVSNQAVSEALNEAQGLKQSKGALIDAALKHLSEGATLPPDVQNELMQAGLEQSGMVTGAASGKGIGGNLLRTILGTAGLNLQKQREAQATSMINEANNLENSRQNVLQSLFPRLAEVQLRNLGGAADATTLSERMKPSSGLSGSDVTNLWLARVGATNQLAQRSADVQAAGTMGAGQSWAGAMGGAFSGLGNFASNNGWLSTGNNLTADQQRQQNVSLGIGAV